MSRKDHDLDGIRIIEVGTAIDDPAHRNSCWGLLKTNAAGGYRFARGRQNDHRVCELRSLVIGSHEPDSVLRS
jgi:hypothetical protein